MTQAREPGLDAAFAQCLESVDSRDPDRAVALRFASASEQGSLAALAAFDLEIADIRTRVSEPMPGEIRLQWWRDRVAASGEDADRAGQGAPVAEALIATIRRHGLAPAAFDRFLEARIFDLYDDPMPDRGSFEAYCGETESTLVMLSALILDPSRGAQQADAAGHCGVALVTARVLELAARRPERAQAFIPGDIFEAAGVTRSAWAASPALAPTVCGAMASLAGEHVSALRRLWPTIPRQARPAFLPCWLVERRVGAAVAALGTTARVVPSAAPVAPLRRSWTYWRAMRAPVGDA